MGEGRIDEVMKRDVFGRVERVVWRDGEGRETPAVRRVVAGPPGLRSFARLLARREARALLALQGAAEGRGQTRAPGCVFGPWLDDRARAALMALHADGQAPPRPRDVFLRPFVAGRALHLVEEIPYDFFDLLEAEVRALHAAGVCHNDLHKEQNIVVTPEGRPVPIDYQLASVHPARGRAFDARCRDDLRHVQKHRRRYTRDGRGPEALRVPDAERMPRKGLAKAWMATVKPAYQFVTRRVLGTKDGEERRPSSGPWPAWGPAIGPAGSSRSGAAAADGDRSSAGPGQGEGGSP